MLSLRAISNFNEFLGLLISSLNNLYVLFLPQHWDMEEERETWLCSLHAYLFQDIDLMINEIKRRNLRVSAKKKLFIITDDFLCLLIFYYMCVYLWVGYIHKSIRFYIHTEACVFLFIFFKNTDGFINISRIHFFHLEKQQQEKQHLMMNMYTFSRHAAFFCTHTCEQISHKQNEMMEKKKCENLPLVDDWGAFVKKNWLRISNVFLKFEIFFFKIFLTWKSFSHFVLQLSIFPVQKQFHFNQKDSTDETFSHSKLKTHSISEKKYAKFFMEVKDKWVHFIYRRYQLFLHIDICTSNLIELANA